VLSAAPHPTEPVTAELLQETQTGPGDLQTSFKMFSNPIALLPVLKKSLRVLTLAQGDETGPAQRHPLAHYWLGCAAPLLRRGLRSPQATEDPQERVFTITIYLSLQAHHCLKEQIQT